MKSISQSLLKNYRACFTMVALATAFLGINVSLFAQHSSSGSVSSSYKLRPTDQIKITVYGQDDLETKQRITGNGYVTIPLLGKVRLASFTVEQAQQYLESKFVTAELLRNPTVTITVEEYSRRTITVLGRVHSPGEVELGVESEAVTISQAIAAAGGFTRLAATSSVKLIRHDPQKGKMTWEIDVDDMLNEYAEGTQIMVYPGDTIFVPERII